MTGGCVGTGSRGWVGGPSGGDDRCVLELEAGGGLVVSVEGMTGGCVLELEAGGGLVVSVEGMTGVCWNWKQGVGWWSQWRG